MIEKDFLKKTLSSIELSKVGKKTIERFNEIGLVQISDLLLFNPLRYKRKILIESLNLEHDNLDGYLEGRVIIPIDVSKSKKIFRAQIILNSQQHVDLIFFHYPQWLAHHLQLGKRLRCYGKLQKNALVWQMVHPEIELIVRNHDLQPQIEAIYKKHQGISTSVLKRIVEAAFQIFAANIKTDWEHDLYKNLSLIHAYALQKQEILNFDQEILKATEFLAKWEAVAYFKQYIFKKEIWNHHQAPILKPNHLSDQLLKSFGYDLTQEQKKIKKALENHLKNTQPAQVFIQGDVGSGKTILGFFALTLAAGQNLQSVFMAPTEILAWQHYEKLRTLLGSDPSIVFLSGSLGGNEKKKILEDIKLGHALIIIGTQSVFQDQVTFCNLSLVIIDEQQRFGVEQRTKLLDKSFAKPHYIILTATPIPRTLALALAGQNHYYLLAEKPALRKEIMTYTVARKKIELVLHSVKNALSKGHCVYWICPFIEATEHSKGLSSFKSHQFLKDHPFFKDYQIGLIHGKMAPSERNTVLKEFYEKKCQLLVSTLVVEVGIDHPGATLIIIESPERLGLAQLHQLRGRVGRGEHQSYCLLIYDDHLSESGIQRLQALCSHHNGPELAQIDLDMRGPGSLLGDKQSGFERFCFFDMQKSKGILDFVACYLAQENREEKELLDDLFHFELNPVYCD